MKKYGRKNISILFTMVVTFLLTVSATVFAVNKIHSKDVSFTPENTEFDVKNVSDALDKLYLAKTNHKLESETLYLRTYGEGNTNPFLETSLVMEKDGYVVIFWCTRSLNGNGTTTASISLDGVVVSSKTKTNSGTGDIYVQEVKKGQTVSVSVKNQIKDGAVFLGIEFVK